MNQVNGNPADKLYPKTANSRRTVPVPPFLRAELLRHRALVDANDTDRVFTDREEAPMLRSNFRRQVRRPTLVRACFLGEVGQVAPERFRAEWRDAEGTERTAEFRTEREAVAHVAVKASGGLRFHDLRHAYATWLVSSGVPVNVVQAVMGPEQASTTLTRYRHTPADFHRTVREVFKPETDDSLTTDDEDRSKDDRQDQKKRP